MEPPTRRPRQRHARGRPDVLRGDRAARRTAALGGRRGRVGGRRAVLHERAGHAQVAQPGRQSGVQCVGAPARHRPGAGGRGPPGHGYVHFGACGGRLPYGRLAGFGGGRRVHGPVQRTQRRAPRPGTCTASRCTPPSAWPPRSPTAPPAGTSPTNEDGGRARSGRRIGR